MEPERHEVGSLVEARAIVRGTDPSTDLSFVVRDNCSLVNARRMWKVVRVGGGDGRLVNPHLLVKKEDAYQVVEQQLRRLRRRASNINTMIEEINSTRQKLQQVLDEGGPGVPQAFEANSLGAGEVFFDFDEVPFVSILGRIGYGFQFGDHSCQIWVALGMDFSLTILGAIGYGFQFG